MIHEPNRRCRRAVVRKTARRARARVAAKSRRAWAAAPPFPAHELNSAMSQVIVSKHPRTFLLSRPSQSILVTHDHTMHRYRCGFLSYDMKIQIAKRMKPKRMKDMLYVFIFLLIKSPVSMFGFYFQREQIVFHVVSFVNSIL